MRRLLTILMIFALILPTGMLSAAKNDVIKVYVDGKLLSFDVKPMDANGTTLVQYTNVFKALGMNSSWDQRTKTVTGYNDYVLMSLTIGEKSATVNNKKVKLAQAARVVDGRTMVPLRFIGEVTGAKVVWDGANRKITITSAPARNELKSIMRGHRWNDSYTTVSKRETATLKTSSTSNKRLLSYNAVEWLSYTAYPTYYFNDEKLNKLIYKLEIKNGKQNDYLAAVGDLYGKLSNSFGEPYLDEVKFSSDKNYTEDTTRIATAVANSQAEIMISWQIGYTDLTINATGDGKGNIVLQITIRTTK